MVKAKMSWTTEWYSVIFTDEQIFNLDGPGMHHHWHDMKREELVLYKRQSGDGSVMIWSGMAYGGLLDICFVENTLSSKKYIQFLEDNLLSRAEDIACANQLLQQDNAPFHASRETKGWLSGKNIRHIDWPSMSSDLNLIENSWSCLVRAV